MAIKNGELPNAEQVINGYGNPVAQLASLGVRSDSSNWYNKDYLAADVFTTSSGTQNSINLGSTTTAYSLAQDFWTCGFTDESGVDATHDPDSFTDPENAFDENEATLATKTDNDASIGYVTKIHELGKTFSEKYVGMVKIKCDNATNSASPECGLKLQSYNGADWSDVVTLATGLASASFIGEYYLNAFVQGVRIESTTYGDPQSSSKYYTTNIQVIAYGDFDASSDLVTNTLVHQIIPHSILVYGDVDFTSGGAIGISVSENNGSTFGITGQSLGSYIDTTSFTAGSLALKFTFTTPNGSVTPQLSGFGCVISDA